MRCRASALDPFLPPLEGPAALCKQFLVRGSLAQVSPQLTPPATGCSLSSVWYSSTRHSPSAQDAAAQRSQSPL